MEPPSVPIYFSIRTHRKFHCRETTVDQAEVLKSCGTPRSESTFNRHFRGSRVPEDFFDNPATPTSMMSMAIHRYRKRPRRTRPLDHAHGQSDAPVPKQNSSTPGLHWSSTEAPRAHSVCTRTLHSLIHHRKLSWSRSTKLTVEIVLSIIWFNF